MIYTLGNSHANLCTRTHYGHQGWGNKTKCFHSFCHRPMSARIFKATHGGSLLHVIERMNPEDFILITVGERDCSQFIPLYCIRTGIDYKEAVELYVASFFPEIEKLQETGVSVIGWGGHPTPPEKFTNDFGDVRIELNLTNDEKISIFRYWDQCIGNRYKNAGIKYVSIGESLLTETGEVNLDFFPKNDGVHLNPDSTYPLLKKYFSEQGFDVTFE